VLSDKTDSSCCGAAPAPKNPFPMAETTCSPAAPKGGRSCCDASAGLQVLPMASDSCCASTAEPGSRPQEWGQEVPGYRLWPFVEGWLDTPVAPVPRVKTALDTEDTFGRWQMRWGIGRDRYRIAPGLYAVGIPDADSPVLVTANYKMTFDALRRDVAGLDVWVLVLETHGINVWCAAGKGTFGTAEVIRRVHATDLEKVVQHRRLILPQLGAPGVSAHEVRKGCGFSVTYGPVRSADVRRFLADGMNATPEMRRVTFNAVERLVLTPVELVMALKPAGWAALALFVLAGFGPGFYSLAAAWHRGLAAAGAVIAALLAGAVITPVLLPWLPWRTFSAKGALVGAAVAAVSSLGAESGLGWSGFLGAVLAIAAGSSYVAMNFTGATPFTSPSGVEREMRRALPWQIGGVALAGVLWFASAF